MKIIKKDNEKLFKDYCKDFNIALNTEKDGTVTVDCYFKEGIIRFDSAEEMQLFINDVFEIMFLSQRHFAKEYNDLKKEAANNE